MPLTSWENYQDTADQPKTANLSYYPLHHAGPCLLTIVAVPGLAYDGDEHTLGHIKNPL